MSHQSQTFTEIIDLLKKVPIESGHYEAIDSYLGIDAELDEPAIGGSAPVANTWASKRAEAWTSDVRPNAYEQVAPSEGAYDRLVVTQERTTVADPSISLTKVNDYDSTEGRNFYDRAAPPQAMYDRAQPLQEAAYDRAEPSQQATYDRAVPSQQNMYDRAEPLQEAAYDSAVPSQQALYDRGVPAQQGMYDRADAGLVRHNTVFAQPSAYDLATAHPPGMYELASQSDEPLGFHLDHVYVPDEVYMPGGVDDNAEVDA